MDWQGMSTKPITALDVAVLNAAYTLGDGEHGLAEIAALVFGGACDDDNRRKVSDSLEKMMFNTRVTVDATSRAAALGLVDPDTNEPLEEVRVDAPLLSGEKYTMTGEDGTEAVVYRFFDVGGE